MGMRTVLHDWHAGHGARMVDFGGWDMPVQYTTIIDEHTAVRTGAGIFDVSHMGRLSFGGTDALGLIEFTKGLLPPTPNRAARTSSRA